MASNPHSIHKTSAPAKMELLAPAGNFEKLEVAIRYGADAVYLGGRDFNLRSFSGRCLMSNFMARRESNRGMCCHPCRFKYTVMEESRPGHCFPLAQDDRGTYLFSAHDLWMIEHLPEMIDAGLGALKI